MDETISTTNKSITKSNKPIEPEIIKVKTDVKEVSVSKSTQKIIHKVNAINIDENTNLADIEISYQNIDKALQKEIKDDNITKEQFNDLQKKVKQKKDKQKNTIQMNNDILNISDNEADKTKFSQIANEVVKDPKEFNESQKVNEKRLMKAFNEKITQLNDLKELIETSQMYNSHTTKKMTFCSLLMSVVGFFGYELSDLITGVMWGAGKVAENVANQVDSDGNGTITNFTKELKKETILADFVKKASRKPKDIVKFTGERENKMLRLELDANEPIVPTGIAPVDWVRQLGVDFTETIPETIKSAYENGMTHDKTKDYMFLFATESVVPDVILYTASTGLYIYATGGMSLLASAGLLLGGNIGGNVLKDQVIGDDMTILGKTYASYKTALDFYNIADTIGLIDYMYDNYIGSNDIPQLEAPKKTDTERLIGLEKMRGDLEQRLKNKRLTPKKRKEINKQLKQVNLTIKRIQNEMNKPKQRIEAKQKENKATQDEYNQLSADIPNQEIELETLKKELETLQEEINKEKKKGKDPTRSQIKRLNDLRDNDIPSLKRKIKRNQDRKNLLYGKLMEDIDFSFNEI